MVIIANPPALLLAASTTSQILNALTDNTFADLYRLQPFDWAILIPYFATLVLLSIYGCHRYEMIRTYYKHRHRMLAEAPVKFAQLPRVTVQLPIYNERYVVERLLEEVSKMDYPKHLLQIQVLDDSTDDTHPFHRGAGARVSGRGRADRVSASDQSPRL